MLINNFHLKMNPHIPLFFLTVISLQFSEHVSDRDQMGETGLLKL